MKTEDTALISTVLNRRKQLIDANNALVWGVVNMCLAFVFTYDAYNAIENSDFYSTLNVFFRIFEWILVVLFTINAVYDFAFFAWPYFWMKPIELTAEQRKLLGVKENEFGFTTTPKTGQKHDSSYTKFQQKTPPFVMTNETPSPSLNTYANKSALNTPNASFYASTPNLSLNASSPNATTSASWTFFRNFSGLNTSSPSINPGFSPINNSLLRKRNTSSLNDSIKDESSLQEYLKSYEETEEKLNQINKVEQQQLHNQNLTSFHGQSSFQTNYQPASDITAVSSPNVEEISSLSANMKSIDDFAARLNVTEMQLYQWIENIRSWISQTILLRVVTEIDKINESLSKSGLTESLIGEIGLSSLKQLASLKCKELPILSAILPYLELSLNQEYLVQRLRDLAKGGCIAEFNWNRGGFHKGKPWTEEWPSDAQILMHVFCCYMDSRLPSHPNCPDDKPFTSMYFKTSAEHPFTKSNLYILQTKLNPPHYNVVQDDTVIEVPSGRNNIFYTLICFLHIVNVKRFGLLGRVNLGPSGVNILWTIEK